MEQQEMACARTAKDRESWRTLADGYFLQLKSTTQGGDKEQESMSVCIYRQV